MAHNQIRLGHELVAHGTVAATLVDFPAFFDAKFLQDQYVPKESRLSQDEAFQAVPSWQHETWDMSGDVYEDTFGYILGAAFGTPTKTVAPGETVVWDEKFVPQDDPWSLSLQWQQTVDYVQAFQALYGVLDELTLDFGTSEELVWKAKGFAFPETTIAQLSAAVLTNRKPLVNWQGQVGLNNLAAPGAPAVVSGAAGLPNGTYKCQVTFVTALGETTGGTEATVTVVNQQIAWSAIPLGPAGTTQRKLYRTIAGGLSGTEKLITTIADNTTTVFTNNVADGALGVAVPQINTSGAFASLVKCKLTWKRNRRPFWVINNTQGPKRMRKGMRLGSVEITVDPDTAGLARYTSLKNGTKEPLNVTFTDAGTTIGTAVNPRLMFDVPNIVWKVGEIDIGADTPLIKLSADKTLYDITAGYQLAMTLRSTKDWSVL